MKKILLLSSYGGYGHIAAANTLKDLLEKEYEFRTIYPIKELQICGVKNGEGFYNWLLANNLNRLCNWIVRNFMGKMFRSREKKLKSQILAHANVFEPDIIVSLIPFVNYAASEAAKEIDLPFLIVTTDNDLKNWVENLERRTYPNIRVTIGSDLPTSRKRLEEKNVPSECIYTVGMPLRPGFMQTRSKSELRAKYEIAEHKNVILIVMGGTGSKITCEYVKALLEEPMDLHLIVCIGRCKALEKLKDLEAAETNSIDLVPFTEKIHELFALSDLLLTKPGPGTINEAFATKLPILIDATKVPIFWERANIDLVLKHQVGMCVASPSRIVEMAKAFLLDEQKREEVARSYEKIPPNRFASEIEHLLDEMIETPREAKASTSEATVL